MRLHDAPDQMGQIKGAWPVGHEVEAAQARVGDGRRGVHDAGRASNRRSRLRPIQYHSRPDALVPLHVDPTR